MGWGEFFALASPATWALAVVLFRRSGETLPAFDLNLVKNTLTFVLFVPLVLAVDGWAWPSFSGRDTAVMLISGLFGMAVADTLYFRALLIMGAGRAGIVGSLLSPFVIILSAVMLGERLGGWQWLGFFLVMAGILFVTWKRHRSEVSIEAIRRGTLIGVTGIFFMALGVVMVKELLEQGPFLSVAFVRLVGGLAGMLVFASLTRRWSAMWARMRKPHPWGQTVFASLLGGFGGMLLWLAGYKLIPAPEASIYNEAQGSFMVLFAWLILGEPMNPRKLVGLALTVIGVVTLLLVSN